MNGFSSIGRALLGPIVVALAASCASVPDENPRFVKRLIRQYESGPLETSPRSISRYEYRGGLVYYVPPFSCCDIPSRLYDSAGKLLCAPDGGFTGRGDGQCPDFLTQRSSGTVLWNDARAQPAR